MTNTEKRNHIFAVVAGTVLLLGLARAGLLVFHDPAFGYLHPGAPLEVGASNGAIALVLMAAVAVITALALRAHPVASIVHALLFFLIAADPIATLWLNSHNPERWALLGAYAVTAMAAVIALGRARRLHWLTFLVGLVAMVCGPKHLVGLPLAVAVLTLPMTMRRSRGHAFAAVAIGLVTALVGLFFNLESGKTATLAAVHRGGSLAPALADHLPPSEPMRTMQAVARNLAASTTFAPVDLDVSTRSARRIVDLPPRLMSFTALLAPLPATAATMIGMLMILTLPFAVYWLAFEVRRDLPGHAAVPAVYVALTTVAAYTIIAASFAGGRDLARAQWLGSLAVLAAIAIVPLVVWQLAQDFWAGRIGLVIAFGIVLLAGGWFAWSRGVPLAIGAVERMAPGTDRTLEISGWALDPRGVKRVYATVGGGPETTAVLGSERRDLQAAYPGYPDALVGGFQMSIASNAWRENQPLRVYVENRTGAVTEIARSDIRLAH